MVNGFTEMIAGSLNLKEPWYVEGAEFLPEEQEVHIYVNVRRNASFVCPNCGSVTTRNGYEPNERVWRHGDCMFYPSFVHCKRPRVHCPNCGSTKVVNAPFERKNSRFTLLFEGYAMLMLADMPRAKASEMLRCDEKSLATILNYWVDEAVKSRPLDDVERLAVDETSRLRGHDYVTVVIDADRRRVIDVEEGRDKETISLFTKKLETRGGDAKAISAVTSDMSKSYLPAIAENFPNAISIIDKFHVKKVLIDALDTVRKEEQKTAVSKAELFRGRRLFMVPKGRMTEAQAEKLNSLSKLYPKTGRAYRIVAALDSFYACQSVEDAEGAFEELYTESYPVSVNDEAGSFSAEIPADNTLQITGCGGTYELDGDVLLLHIVTEFASGRSFEYDVDCERVPPAETVTDEPYTMVTSKFSVDGLYTGEWRDGKPNGTGTLTIQETNDRWDTGDTLWSEDWVDGLIEGYGEWRSAVDGAYDGNFSSGLKDGYGRMWFGDGRVYDGKWSRGSFKG